MSTSASNVGKGNAPQAKAPVATTPSSSKPQTPPPAPHNPSLERSSANDGDQPMRDVGDNDDDDDDNDTEPTTMELKETLRVKLPDTYNGSRGELENFLLQAELYHHFNNDKFPYTSSQSLWASSYLRGEAGRWMEPFLRDYFEKGSFKNCMYATREILGSWKGFKKEIRRMFGDIDEKKTAETKLYGLRQTSSVTAYSTEFQKYGNKTGWDSTALLSHYTRGLKGHVREELARIEPQPQNMIDMIALTVRIDNRMYEFQKESRSLGQHRHGKKYVKNEGRKRYRPNENQWSDPMELDGAEKRTRGHSEKGKRREKGLCYTCGKPGHMARECSQEKKQGGKPWNKPKREFGLAERKTAYREGAAAERTAQYEPEESDGDSFEMLDEEQESQIVVYRQPSSLRQLPELYELWSVTNEAGGRREWSHTGTKGHFVEKHRTDDAPPQGLTCVVVYVDEYTIVFAENTGGSGEVPKRYTANLRDPPKESKYEPLEKHLEVEDTWEVLAETDEIRFWRRRQPLSEVTETQPVCEDEIQGHAEFKELIPYTLVTYPHGTRKWLDETTGEIITEQRKAPDGESTGPELAATGECDQLITPVLLEGIEAKALIDSGAMGRFIHPAFVKKWDVPIVQRPKPYQLTLLDGTGAGSDGWIRYRTGGIKMIVNGHEEVVTFDVAPIGRHDIVLGTLWLFSHNPSIDWVTKTVKFDNCHCKGS